jgi:hypothetical protein
MRQIIDSILLILSLTYVEWVLASKRVDSGASFLSELDDGLWPSDLRWAPLVCGLWNKRTGGTLTSHQAARPCLLLSKGSGLGEFRRAYQGCRPANLALVVFRISLPTKASAESGRDRLRPGHCSLLTAHCSLTPNLGPLAYDAHKGFAEHTSE